MKNKRPATAPFRHFFSLNAKYVIPEGENYIDLLEDVSCLLENVESILSTLAMSFTDAENNIDTHAAACMAFGGSYQAQMAKSSTLAALSQVLKLQARAKA